jgi:hypothetical protein
MKSYTRAQIKKAFFLQFRGAGELWFPYEQGGMNATQEKIDRPVQVEFYEFMNKLKAL